MSFLLFSGVITGFFVFFLSRTTNKFSKYSPVFTLQTVFKK